LNQSVRLRRPLRALPSGDCRHCFNPKLVNQDP
jgi:hypothetical protein